MGLSRSSTSGKVTLDRTSSPIAGTEIMATILRFATGGGDQRSSRPTPRQALPAATARAGRAPLRGHPAPAPFTPGPISAFLAQIRLPAEPDRWQLPLPA